MPKLTNTYMELSSFLSKVQQAKELDFGDIFGKSIDLFKKTWGQGFLNLLFAMMFIIPLVIIIYIPIISYAVAQDGSSIDPDEFPLGIILSTVGFALVAIVLLGAFIMALKAGFYYVVRKIDEDEEVTFKDHFVFFKAKYLKKTFVLSLISAGIGVLAYILCFLPIIYVMVPLSLTALIFTFNTNLSSSEIIKASFSLGNKKWLIIFGLLFVSGIMAELIGLLLCGIGIFFTISFVYLPVYIVYKEVIGFEDDDEIKQIGIEQD